MATEIKIWTDQNLVFSLSERAAPESPTHYGGVRTYVHVLVNFLKPLLEKSIRRRGGDGALRKEAKDSLRGRAGTCVLAERG